MSYTLCDKTDKHHMGDKLHDIALGEYIYITIPSNSIQLIYINIKSLGNFAENSLDLTQAQKALDRVRLGIGLSTHIKILVLIA